MFFYSGYDELMSRISGIVERKTKKIKILNQRIIKQIYAIAENKQIL
jgi:hypothetical protein